MHRRLAIFTHRFLINTNPIPFTTATSTTFLYTQSNSLKCRTNGLAFFRLLSFTPVHRRAPDPDDPSNLMKEDGVSVCSQMWIENFRESNGILSDLIAYLRWFELWVLAYQKVCADDMGAYMPRCATQTSALEDLLALKNVVKWGARLDFLIKSPKYKTHYQSLSKRKIKAILTTTQPTTFQDKIVQEVLFMILELMNEAQFSQKSFAFRPGRNAHTVLRTASTTPVISSRLEEPKMKLKRKIQKKRVLAEDESKPDPYWSDTFFGFAPEEAEKVPSWGHCGILNPLLANICLDELHRWMEGRIKEFYLPSKSDVIWNGQEREAEQGNTSWSEFVPTSCPNKTKKMDYKYMLKLDNESLPIELITKGIMFLDHVLCRRVVYPALRRGSLAKLYAAKHKLCSLAKVYKIGSWNLSRLLKEKKGSSLDYHNLLRMGLTESVDGLQYTRMSHVPETDYTPFSSNWTFYHEKALLEYIRLGDPKTLEDQRFTMREQGLISPQDYTLMLVWNYKRNTISMDQLSLIKSGGNKVEKEQRLLLGSDRDKYTNEFALAAISLMLGLSACFDVDHYDEVERSLNDLAGTHFAHIINPAFLIAELLLWPTLSDHLWNEPEGDRPL
ncbi:hypothetical protein SADUNF_Sadunf01G0121300 [Salix dunnii]|uniref:Uncharacterized protein n=1 Tax=Salix dunnii TaxID=1413687 RepID=A0A835TN99_9ROSI|nr:hypothetical protein SADUNF_Sadunf01G0121300 [Salix dunnii]